MHEVVMLHEIRGKQDNDDDAQGIKGGPNKECGYKVYQYSGWALSLIQGKQEGKEQAGEDNAKTIALRGNLKRHLIDQKNELGCNFRAF